MWPKGTSNLRMSVRSLSILTSLSSSADEASLHVSKPPLSGVRASLL